MALLYARDDPTGLHFQGSIELDGSITLVVVGSPLNLTWTHW